ncbi:MAG: ElyC/SanA/YdcF family protein [Candidatus Bipolaricaulota bacterium]
MIEVGAVLADPVPWVCLALATAALWAMRHSRLLATWLGMCVVILYALSVGPGADLLLRPLERAYPPLHQAPAEPISAVVVLSGGDGWWEDRPLTSALSTSSTDRLLEGIRVWRLLGGTHELLVVGGIGVPGGRAEAPAMAQAAHALGVPEETLAWESLSRNTYENALAVREILGEEPFVLVTSAFHMPRAMQTFHRLELDPIPAPCGHAARISYSGWDWFPQAQTLWRSAQAIREHVARVWYRLRHGPA